MRSIRRCAVALGTLLAGVLISAAGAAAKPGPIPVPPEAIVISVHHLDRDATPLAGDRPAATGAGASSAVATVAARDVPRKRGASKILILVATICVIGVSVATIRAIIAQRAIRIASA